MAIKKRCIRCLKVLHENGTCQNEKCSRYIKPAEKVAEKKGKA